jgi:hypothetical protein
MVNGKKVYLDKQVKGKDLSSSIVYFGEPKEMRKKLIADARRILRHE